MPKVRREGLAVQPSPFGLTLGSLSLRRGGWILLSCFFPLLRFTHPEHLVIPAELGQTTGTGSELAEHDPSR